MSQRTEPTSLMKTDQLWLYNKILTLYCDCHIKHMEHCECNMHNFGMLHQVVHVAAVALYGGYEVLEVRTAQRV